MSELTSVIAVREFMKQQGISVPDISIVASVGAQQRDHNNLQSSRPRVTDISDLEKLGFDPKKIRAFAYSFKGGNPSTYNNMSRTIVDRYGVYSSTYDLTSRLNAFRDVIETPGAYRDEQSILFDK
jgi:hypothetical protein